MAPKLIVTGQEVFEIMRNMSSTEQVFWYTEAVLEQKRNERILPKKRPNFPIRVSARPVILKSVMDCGRPPARVPYYPRSSRTRLEATPISPLPSTSSTPLTPPPSTSSSPKPTTATFRRYTVVKNNGVVKHVPTITINDDDDDDLD